LEKHSRINLNTKVQQFVEHQQIAMVELLRGNLKEMEMAVQM